ncbi:hypothetical protein D9M69_668660 [compost metagenome]
MTARHRDVDEGDHAQPDMACIQPRGVAADQPQFLEPPVAPQALRGRQLGHLGQVQVGRAAVRLEVVQNPPIGPVEFDDLQFCLPMCINDAIMFPKAGKARGIHAP